MKCTKCRNEWDSQVKVNFCPFCGAEIERHPVEESCQKNACPICGAVLNGTTCPQCGYDQSCDVETFETICAALPSNRKTLTQRKQEYAASKIQNTAQMVYEPFWRDNDTEQAYVKAQCDLGDCYYYGRGVAQDYNQAIAWYRKSAEQGYARAQCNLGDCYKFGRGMAEDDGQAIEWYLKAAQQGYTRAQYILGLCYESGSGVDLDREMALQWYKKAAKKSLNEAGALFSEKGVPEVWADMLCEDYSAAPKHIKTPYVISEGKSAISSDETCSKGEITFDASLPDDMVQSGQPYSVRARSQVETSKHLSEQARLQNTAEQLNTEQFECSNCGYVVLGHASGKCPICEAMVKWLPRKVDEQNIQENEQMLRSDYIRAVNIYGTADVLYRLAMCYLNNSNVPKGLFFLEQLAISGFPEAQFQLGMCCKTGKGRKTDNLLAASWLYRAAIQGHVQAKDTLKACLCHMPKWRSLMFRL